ncbi:MAG: amidohydrolase [Leptospiraceae bacterium]|nr:amidohydrolase [Leptospiraceae bacterium]
MKDLNPNIVQEIIDWRHQIHAYPELAFQEYRTSDLVAEKLTEFDVEVHRGLAGTGVVGVLNRGDGPKIGLRADMDALPLQEENSFAHKSMVPGRMHACGHDGHTAMLLGAAKILAADNDWQGTIVFIFQPAEENEGGGKKMVEEGLFKTFPVDAVFGLHNWPTLPVGKIAVNAGPMMAGSDSFEIKIEGKGTHAAMPNTGNDLLVLASQLVLSFQTIISREIHPLESGVISVTQIHGGDAFNILPASVILRGTVRYFKPHIQDFIQSRMQKMISNFCDLHNCSFHFSYSRRYPPTVNSANESEFCKNTVRKLFGTGNLVEDSLPSMGAEDFSFMLNEKPGCYIWLGNGEKQGGCMLHNPNYDFNDDAVIYGVQYWVGLAKEYLKSV